MSPVPGVIDSRRIQWSNTRKVKARNASKGRDEGLSANEQKRNGRKVFGSPTAGEWWRSFSKHENQVNAYVVSNQKQREKEIPHNGRHHISIFTGSYRGYTANIVIYL